MASQESDLIIEPAEFWFIWTKTGHLPRRAHNTLEAAQTEAQRLARLCPGKKFIILQGVQKLSAMAVSVETQQEAA